MIDTEGNARDYRHDPLAQTMGISLAWRPSPTAPVQSIYFPYYHLIGLNLGLHHLDQIKALIEAHPCLVFHNAKYDILALENLGINVRHKKFYDTMLMGHWINENMLNKGLDAMSRLYGGQPKNRPEIMTRFIKTPGLGWQYIPADMMAEYSANDAFITYELFEKLYPIFCEEGYDGELWEFECEFLRIVLRMEGFGVRIDSELCESEIIAGELRMSEISQSMNGLNPNSPKDLEFLLIDCLGLEPFKRTNSGAISFDRESMEHFEEELEYIDDPTAKLVLEYRGWLKATSAYYRAYLHLQSHNGNLHPNFKLHGTRTGRLSCERPNLQQIPRQSTKRWNGNAKRAIVSRPGHTLWEVDYANLEFRLGALYANEKNMINPLVQGFKPFDAMAELIYGKAWTQEDRQGCKTFTYMTAYSAGISKIARTMHKEDAWASKMRADWFKAYPGMKTAARRATSKAEARGYALLWSGRRRHFDGGRGTHKAFNAVIQGGAAELVKRTMLVLSTCIDWVECKMLLQVHDSVVFEIMDGKEDKWLPIIQQVMESVEMHHPRFGMVPFPCDIKKWGTEFKWVNPLQNA